MCYCMTKEMTIYFHYNLQLTTTIRSRTRQHTYSAAAGEHYTALDGMHHTVHRHTIYLNALVAT